MPCSVRWRAGSPIDPLHRSADKVAMSDAAPIDPYRRRARPGPVLLLVLLAFLAGAVLAGYLVRHVAWFDRLGLRSAAASPVGNAGESYTPPDGQPAVAPRIDPAVLQTREAALAAQLAALEARTASLGIDAAAAGTQASRAEAVLTTASARRAVDRGQPLGYLEAQLRSRFGATQPRAVAVVIDGARQPVTLEDLRQGLDAIAPDVTTGAGDGWAASLRRELGSLIVLRRAGTPSPLPADRMARARRLVEAGQVEAARAEVARLPGARDAANWENAAQRYLAVRRALDVLEYVALTAQGPQPVTAPAPVAPATPAEG